MPTVAATTILDRMGPRRSDPEYLKSLIEARGARFLVLAVAQRSESLAPRELYAGWGWSA